MSFVNYPHLILLISSQNVRCSAQNFLRSKHTHSDDMEQPSFRKKLKIISLTLNDSHTTTPYNKIFVRSQILFSSG